MNGRPLSPFIKNFFASRAALDARAYNTHLAFLIRLKTDALIPLSTEPLLMTSQSKGGESVTLLEPISFQGKVLTAPDIQFTQTDASDGSTQIIVSNLDYLLTSLIPEEDRLFDGATVTVYLCFKKPDGTYEGLIYGKGNLKAAEGDHEFAPFSYVSDLSDKTKTAGGVELTQKCTNLFGVFDAARRSWCPASGFPSGSKCSKVFDDDEAGCAFWGLQAFFKGVPFFNPNGLVDGYGGVVTGGGWIEPPVIGGCYDLYSFYDTPEGARRGDLLKEGDALLNPYGETVIIQSLEVLFSRYRYLLETPSGAAAICSADHRVLTGFGDEKGTALYSLIQSEAENLKGRVDGNFEKTLRLQLEAGLIGADAVSPHIIISAGAGAFFSPFTLRLAEAGKVLRLTVSSPNTYQAGLRPNLYVGAHNKPIYQNLPIY